MRMILAVLSDRVVSDCERESESAFAWRFGAGMFVYSQQDSDCYLSGGRAAERPSFASALPAERRLWRASALGD